jgi:hypothetical protein
VRLPHPLSQGCGQLHFELLAFMKLLTELTTLAPSLATVAISPAEGLDDSAPTEALSASTDEVIALVWVGKSLLAELTTVVASLSILPTWDFTLLTSPLEIELVSPLTEFCRLARSVQYAGLLLLQPASTIAAATKANRTAAGAAARPGRDLIDIALILTSAPIGLLLTRLKG